MALIRCLKCNRVMPSAALSCPRCGKPTVRPAKNKQKNIQASGLLLLLVFPLAYVVGSFVAALIIVIVFAIVLRFKRR